jgi:CubicO group peptidase (beta-lactamase class C family)
MKKIMFFFALLCVVFGPARSQTIPAELATLLDEALDSMLIETGNKGMGAAVYIPDGAVWKGAAGANSAFGQLNTNHIFNTGSVTKTLTAACVLHMADEGLLSLNDSLHKWLDTLPHINPNISIRQLLRHQSGLYDYLYNPNYGQSINTAPDSTWKLQDVLETFMLPPLAPAGGTFSYCNSNYMLLGMIIERVSGNSYVQEMEDRLLTPLGLNSVVLPPYQAFFPQPVAHLWFDLDGNGTLEDAHNLFSNWDSFYSTAAPAGGYFSKPEDMARWVRLYMTAGFLSPQMIAEAKSTITAPGLLAGTKYGLGLMERNIGGQKTFGHGGDAGYSAGAWYFPNLDIGIAVLNNDGFTNSWELLPTVEALLKAYQVYLQAVSSPELTQPSLQIDAFPNPFGDQIEVCATLLELGSEIQFRLTDARGVMVSEHTYNLDGNALGLQRFSLENLSILPTGCYFLSAVVDGRRRLSNQLLIKK